MSITKLKTLGRWGALTNDLTRVGTHLGGRRVITGMLTGLARPGEPEEPREAGGEAWEAMRAIPPPPPAVARIAGTRPGLRQK